MNDSLYVLIPAALAAYCLGNINPAILLGKFYGVDVRAQGSGNAGTTNALRVLGKKSGIIVLVIDVLKGVVAALSASLLVSSYAGLLCGLCVIVGHMWPVFFGFRGGKGVATTLGALLALQPLLALALLVLFAAVVAITRMVSLGVCIAAIASIPVALVFGWYYVIWMAIVAILVMFKHRSNILRIFRREEPKLSFGTRDSKRA